MHVDPLVVMAKSVIDATGHDCEVARTLERKNNIRLLTETGSVMGERSLSVDEAERTTIENTKEIFPVFMSRAWLPMVSAAATEWDQSLAECYYRVRKLPSLLTYRLACRCNDGFWYLHHNYQAATSLHHNCREMREKWH